MMHLTHDTKVEAVTNSGEKDGNLVQCLVSSSGLKEKRNKQTKIYQKHKEYIFLQTRDQFNIINMGYCRIWVLEPNSTPQNQFVGVLAQ